MKRDYPRDKKFSLCWKVVYMQKEGDTHKSAPPLYIVKNYVTEL